MSDIENKGLPTHNEIKTDGWNNLLAGLGKKQDKTRHTTYLPGCFLDDVTLDNIYVGEGFGAVIVDEAADDMTREWVTITGDDEGKIHNELMRLHAESVFNQALKWSRLYGGSGIVIGVSGSGKMEEPLTVGKGKKVTWLEVIARPQILISSSKINENMESENYGQVELFNVQAGLTNQPKMIHSSKFLVFKGKSIPPNFALADIEKKYWGMGVIQAVWEYLQMYGSVNQSVANLLLEFVVGKFKLAGLQDMLANGQEERLIKRMDVINMTKSMINAVLLGDDEEYTRDSATVSGIPDLIDRFQMNLAAVAQYPVTKLFGRSPAGMNATGESDTTNYYDRVASEQENILREPLQKLVNIIAVTLGLTSDLNTSEFPIVFNPLYQLTEKEKAETEKIQSDTYHTYIGDGVLDADEVREIKFPMLDNAPNE